MFPGWGHFSTCDLKGVKYRKLHQLSSVSQTTVTCTLTFSPVNRKWHKRVTNPFNEFHELQIVKQRCIVLLFHFYLWGIHCLKKAKVQQKLLQKVFLGISLPSRYLLKSFMVSKQYMALTQTSQLLAAVVNLLSSTHLLSNEQQKHLQPGETWLPGVSPVSRDQIIERVGRKNMEE